MLKYCEPTPNPPSQAFGGRAGRLRALALGRPKHEPNMPGGSPRAIGATVARSSPPQSAPSLRMKRTRCDRAAGQEQTLGKSHGASGDRRSHPRIAVHVLPPGRIERRCSAAGRRSSRWLPRARVEVESQIAPVFAAATSQRSPGRQIIVKRAAWFAPVAS
jgi:hypothetical protein